MKKAAIIGARGYTAFELIKILQRHREVELVALADIEDVGKPIAECFPLLRGLSDLRIISAEKREMLLKADVVFLALPHRAAQEYAPYYLNKGKIVIDLSADFRFKNVAVYEKTYNIAHTAKTWNRKAVYGLPPIYRARIKRARLIANPGCYPTSVILGLAPLVKKEFIDPRSIIVDAKSGVSGAGRRSSPGTHYPECNESIMPYAVGVHRHGPEMEERLSDLAGKQISVLFVPHLAPMDRGILSTIYVKVKGKISEEVIRSLYTRRYAREPFVRVCEPGRMPKTKDVAYTNFCDIGITYNAHTSQLVVCSVIDNLIKGASGQAVENMNIIFGFDETMGLL